MVKKYGLLFLIVIEFPLLLIGHQIAPMSLAGPGLDLWIILASFIFNLLMLVVGFRNWNKGLIPKFYLPAIVISTLLIRFWMYSKR